MGNIEPQTNKHRHSRSIEPLLQYSTDFDAACSVDGRNWQWY